MNTKRRTFSVSAETDSGEVLLTFNFSRKSQQAILFDCGAKKETLEFAYALSEGVADFGKRPTGSELDLVERSIADHFLKNELVLPVLTAEELKELSENLEPQLLKSIQEQIKAKAFPDVAKN